MQKGKQLSFQCRFVSVCISNHFTCQSEALILEGKRLKERKGIVGVKERLKNPGEKTRVELSPKSLGMGRSLRFPAHLGSASV